MDSIYVVTTLFVLVIAEITGWYIIRYPGAAIRWLMFREKTYNKYLGDHYSINILYSIFFGVFAFGLFQIA